MAGILLSLGNNVSKTHDKLRKYFIECKNLKNTYESVDDIFCISKFYRLNDNEKNILTGDNVSIFCVGTILFDDFFGKDAIIALKKQLLHSDINDVIDSLDGHFILIIINHKANILNVVTDHAGMMHVYRYIDDKNIYLSSSSIVLSKHFNVTVDVEGMAQFLRCDSICDYDTIYNEIKVLEPGSIYTFKLDGGRVIEDKYVFWKSPISIEEDMTIQEATELWAKTILDVGQIISKNKVICDLTGGFDSRSILASMLPYVEKQGDGFSTFVFGPDRSSEVKVAKKICSHLDIKNNHLTLPSEWKDQFSGYLIASLNYTDGEENICNYAPILFANQQKSKNFTYSVNGMSGGCVRSFFWVQEMVYEKKPANIDRFINMRVLQYEYDTSMFKYHWRKNLEAIPDLLKKKYLDSISDMDLGASYNTLQLDNIDLRQRERRWGGRTISSSNQIIGIISPLYFKRCMDVGMKIPPKYKIRDRLNKRVISKINPELASQSMLTGVPCEEVTLQNFYKFSPMMLVYLKKAAKVLSRQLFNRTVFVDRSLVFPKYIWYQVLFSRSGQSEIGKLDSWVSQGMYDEEMLEEFIDKAQKPGFRYYGQLEKMISLEMRLRNDNGKKEFWQADT